MLPSYFVLLLVYPMFLINLLEYYRRARWDVELQPLLLVAFVQRLKVGKVREARVGEAITAKHGIVGIEHLLV